MKSKKPDLHDNLKRRTLKSLLTGGLGAAFGISGWAWLMSRENDDGIPWPFRKILRMNETLWHGFFNSSRTSPLPNPPSVEKPVRVNGNIGLPNSDDSDDWAMKIISPIAYQRDREISLSALDLATYPERQCSTEFKCIEGWSETFSYAGISFVELMRNLKLGTRSGKWPEESQNLPQDLYSYVGLETPDGKYYVSLDMDSMLHSQTLLALEMNGLPLTAAHGAPARLVIPIKYGIKSLKKIGKIFFSDTRPRDYWAERGYDWYAGL